MQKRNGFSGRIITLLLAASLIVASCGSSGEDRKPSSAPTGRQIENSPRSPLTRRGLFAAGASVAQSRCILRAIPNPITGAEERSAAAFAEDLEQAIVEFGSECAKGTRLVELAAESRVEVTRMFEQAFSGWFARFRDLFEEAGASSKEAGCLARLVVFNVELKQGADPGEVMRSVESTVEREGTPCMPRDRLTTVLGHAFRP